MTSTTSGPSTVRALDTPAARELADLAAIFDELQTVLRCCERLVAELGAGEPDDLILESVWATAVLSYTRCFRTSSKPGAKTTALTEEDVGGTGLQGEVLEWHKVLLRMRKHYADPAVNPREQFTIGAAQDSHGKANGIAITSARQPRLDDVTVRQTGAIAYHLSELVDKRIAERQERLLEHAGTMPKSELDRLPLIDLTTESPA
jgi:hypothetical protein